jgi:Ca-activated chloride channel family protein
MFDNIEFSNPLFFWLFLTLPLAIAWYIWKRKKQTPSVKLSSIKGFKAGSSFLPKLRPFLFVLRLVALAALITAMARPQTTEVTTKTKNTRGIDIIIAIDVSASMLAKDLRPNRLEALKLVAADFI